MRRLMILVSLFLVGALGCITLQTAPSAQQPTTSPPSQPTTQQPATLPEIVAFSATPAAITSGGSSTLLWNVTGATSVSIDHGVGNVPVAGTMSVSPYTTTTYTLTASNAAGSVPRQVVVTVGAASPPPLIPTAYSVINVTASADPPSSTGACPKNFDFYGTITVNGPCIVTYRWERSNGDYSSTANLSFASAGSQTVVSNWQLAADYSGWQRLHVLSPNETWSNQAYFTLSCGFAVTNVTASADPPSYTGACPKTFNFYGVITANGPGTVTYTWERSDGALAPTYSLTFPSAGSATVTDYWQLGASGPHWERLHVFTPNEMVSNQANFTLTCP
jgi:hypothetical protein